MFIIVDIADLKKVTGVFEYHIEMKETLSWREFMDCMEDNNIDISTLCISNLNLNRYDNSYGWLPINMSYTIGDEIGPDVSVIIPDPLKFRPTCKCKGNPSTCAICNAWENGGRKCRDCNQCRI